MQDNGIEIGSHTANHIPLNEVPVENLDNEIKLSKLLMEWNEHENDILLFLS